MMTRTWDRALTRMMFIVVMITALVSCGNTAATTNTPNNENATSSLVIYSGRSEALIAPIIQAFSTLHPDINVELKAGKNNELAAAILEEKANPQADVFISTDMLTHINLSKEGALSASPIKGSEAIPAELKASDGTWTSITSRGRVIMYNTTLVSEADAPKSIFELTDPKWKGKIAAANSTNGAMQAQVAALMTLIGTDATQAWLDGLVANDVTFFGGHTDVRKAVGAGEFAIGLVNHYYYELQKREATDNEVGVIYPDQGADQIGVMMNTTAIGQIAGSPNSANAQLFAEFLFTPETQKLFADLNYEYPIIAGVSVAEGVDEPTSFKTTSIDMQAIASDVPNAVQMMQGAGIP